MAFIMLVWICVTLSTYIHLSDCLCCDCVTTASTKGCAQDIDCQNTICNYDSYCCTTAWDGYCSGNSTNICSLSNGNIGTCCNCLIASSNTGCSLDLQCQTNICADDDFCCNNEWDYVCVNSSAKICSAATVSPTLFPTTINPTLSPTSNPTTSTTTTSQNTIISTTSSTLTTTSTESTSTLSTSMLFTSSLTVSTTDSSGTSMSTAVITTTEKESTGTSADLSKQTAKPSNGPEIGGQLQDEGTFSSSIFGEYTDVIIFILMGTICCCLLIGCLLLLLCQKKKKHDIAQITKKQTIEMQQQQHIKTDMNTMNRLSVPMPAGGFHGVMYSNSTNIPGSQSYESSESRSINIIEPGSPKEIVIKINTKNVSLPSPTPGDMFNDADYDQEEENKMDYNENI